MAFTTRIVWRVIPKNADRVTGESPNADSTPVANGTDARLPIEKDSEMRDVISTASALNDLDELDEFELALVNGETVKRKRVRRRKKKNASPDKENQPAQARPPAKERAPRSYMEPPSKRNCNSHLRYVGFLHLSNNKTRDSGGYRNNRWQRL